MPLLSTDYLKQFCVFLDQASATDLLHRREGLQNVYETARDREFRQTLRWLMRKVDEEILTRLTAL